MSATARADIHHKVDPDLPIKLHPLPMRVVTEAEAAANAACVARMSQTCMLRPDFFDNFPVQRGLPAPSVSPPEPAALQRAQTEPASK